MEIVEHFLETYVAALSTCLLVTFDHILQSIFLELEMSQGWFLLVRPHLNCQNIRTGFFRQLSSSVGVGHD